MVAGEGDARTCEGTINSSSKGWKYVRVYTMSLAINLKPQIWLFGTIKGKKNACFVLRQVPKCYSTRLGRWRLSAKFNPLPFYTYKCKPQTFSN